MKRKIPKKLDKNPKLAKNVDWKGPSVITDETIGNAFELSGKFIVVSSVITEGPLVKKF